MKIQSFATCLTLLYLPFSLFSAPTPTPKPSPTPAQTPNIQIQLQQVPLDENNNGPYYSPEPNEIRVYHHEDHAPSHYQSYPNTYNQNDYSNPSSKPMRDRTENEQNMNKRPQQPIKATQQTLSIIKPDAVMNNHIGDIISRFERSGLHVAAIKMVLLTKDQAEKFYFIHRERPFYPALVDFMSSGPVVVMVLEGENAIAKNRELMGATNPQKADRGTIRSDFAESISRNAVHGSDSPEAAQEEIFFFFKPNEIVNH